jgi:hypothetical protein
MNQSRDDRSSSHPNRQESVADGLASEPAQPYRAEDVVGSSGTGDDLSASCIKQPSILRHCPQVHLYMHEEEGVQLPQICGLRANIMTQPYIIARSSISADLDDWVVVVALRAISLLDEFPGAELRDRSGPITIVTPDKDGLPAQTGDLMPGTEDAAPVKRDYRYIDSRRLSSPTVLPIALGNLRLLEVVPREEWQKEYGDLVKEISARGFAYVVVRPHERFHGVKTVALLDASFERALVENSCEPWPKTAIDTFVGYHERLQATMQEIASVVVDTYISYALFRGLAILSESLSEHARGFFAERGWVDLSWKWPGFDEHLASENECRMELASRKDDGLESPGECPSPLTGAIDAAAKASTRAHEHRVEYDPESVLDEEPSELAPYAQRSEPYGRFPTSVRHAHTVEGFLCCANTAPLTEEQRRSVRELSLHWGVPDWYQEEKIEIALHDSKISKIPLCDTKDFVVGKIKENVASAIEKSLLALLDYANTEDKDVASFEEGARSIYRASRGEVLLCEEVEAVYSALTEKVCSVATEVVSSTSPVVQGEPVQCATEVQAILRERVREMISEESCNVLEWLHRFRNIRSSNKQGEPDGHAGDIMP